MLPKDPIKRAETLLKLKAAAQRRAKDPEWLKNNSESHKGKPSWNKGIPMSDDAKIKLSKKRIDMKIKDNDETKEKKRFAKLGKKRSKETCEKISKSLTGKKKSILHNENNRLSHLGQTPYNKGEELSYNQILKITESKKGGLWYGNVSNDLPMTQLVRKLPEYKIWVKNVLERDEYKDVNTKEVCNQPEAHHIISVASIIKKYDIKTLDDARNCKELWNINNGITLEYKNHMKLHGFKY